MKLTLESLYKDHDNLRRILSLLERFMLNKGISDEKFREEVKLLIKDHTELEGITRDVIKAVEPMLVSPHSDITDIGNKLSALINRQRAHLLLEEMNIYPHIEEHIDSEDWETIAALIPDFEDPIFCDKVRKEYELIFKAL
jgi:hemerythrin-like domain-containing protein